MVDLDSDPTKLIEVVEIGKQLLMTRGALTTFSIANDLAKYFAIVPALFAATLPWLKSFDVMNLHSATSAILSAVIFNAIIIPLLIPIALKGVRYRPVGADALLRRNMLVWGLGGVVAPFIGIKLIDIVLAAIEIHDLVALAALLRLFDAVEVEVVAARATIQHITVGSAGDDVVAVAALQHVFAGPATQDIREIRAGDLVVAALAIDEGQQFQLGQAGEVEGVGPVRAE